MLCVFAILLGNDYVDKSIFKSLLDTFDGTNNNLKLRKLNRNLSGYAKRKNTHNKKLIEMLASFETIDECVQQILKFVKIDKHALIKNAINDSIAEYCLLKPSNTGYYLTKIREFYSNCNSNLGELLQKNLILSMVIIK